MSDTFSVMPAAFWVVAALLIAGMLRASRWLRQGIGLPVMAVLGTVGVWYVGDVLYNDYKGDYAKNFTHATLEDAWWQVALFLAVFIILAPLIHRIFNSRYLPAGSQVFQMEKKGVGQRDFQLNLKKFFWACFTAWVVLIVLAVGRLHGDILNYFLPFLAERSDPWQREGGRVGIGIDSLLSLASYVQIFLAATFGVVAALAREPRIRGLALICCALSWPYFIFDRTRNSILAVVVPGVLAWVFLRLRGGLWQKIAVLSASFLLINAWFGFVIANRSDMSISDALKEKKFNLTENAGVHHEGLNMYEELCWVNQLTTDRSFSPAWGRRYFAELVNPIPRSLWRDKPFIGIDYSIARGQGLEGGEAGVGATIATGMIGQGVINFGPVFGTAAAAFLMSLWTALLARLDLRGREVGRIPLYAIGLILTFNLGRDITFITLYTFLVGAALMWSLDLFFVAVRRKPRETRSAEVNVAHGEEKAEIIQPNDEPQAVVPSQVSENASENNSINP
jgi:hypothetical protein